MLILLLSLCRWTVIDGWFSSSVVSSLFVSRIRDNRWTLRITLRNEKTQRNTGETVERRTRRLLKGCRLAEDNAGYIGRCGSSMLRPSPNHGTLWLHNDDDDLQRIDISPSIPFFSVNFKHYVDVYRPMRLIIIVV